MAIARLVPHDWKPPCSLWDSNEFRSGVGRQGEKLRRRQQSGRWMDGIGPRRRLGIHSLLVLTRLKTHKIVQGRNNFACEFYVNKVGESVMDRVVCKKGKDINMHFYFDFG